ncbi:TPA: hypothetical protein ACX6QU_001345 [Photobacterium damselae]
MTQQDFVDLLSNEFTNLKKLDTVTLSRWENKKTYPPLKKQFQILDYIGSLKKFINDSPSQQLDYKSKISHYIHNKFENSVHILSEITTPEQPDYTILKNDNIRINYLFKKYLKTNNIEEISMRNNINTISWIKNNQTYACLIYIDNIDNTFHDSIVFAGLFAKTKNSFEKLFIFLYDYLCTVKYKNIIIHSFDDNDYQLLKNLNGKQIQSNRISNNTVKCSFKFNRIDFLSNKYLFNYYKSI